MSSVAASKPGTCINIISVEPDMDTVQLSTDFGLLASVVVGGGASVCEVLPIYYISTCS